MLKTIEVVFDGKVFVPTEPVELPTGTKAILTVSEVPVSEKPLPGANLPPAMNDEEQRTWERLCQQWAATPPPFPTVEEALAYSRCSPWPELLLTPDLVDPPTSNGKYGDN